MNIEAGMSVLFGPRRDRGVVLGLRVPQLLLLTAGLGTLTVTLGYGRTATLGGVVIAAAAATVALLPVGGRTADRWAPIAVRYLTRRAGGGARRRRPIGAPVADPVLVLPTGRRLDVRSVATPGGAAVAVATDRWAGAAVARVRGGGFTFADPAEQARRAYGWVGVLAAAGRDGTPLARVQWVHRTRPMPRVELDRVAAAPTAGTWPAAGAAYADLLDAADALVHRDMFLTVTVPTRRGGDSAELLRELATLQTSVESAGIEVVGWLPPRLLAAAVRSAYAPAALAPLATRDDDPATVGAAPALAGPAAAEEQWGCYRCDDAWHVTYWIAEWPRLEVSVDFLTPLLVDCGCAHTVAVTAEPLSSRAALREARSLRATDIADAALRDRIGQVPGARDEAAADGADRLDAELAAGHVAYRFHGFVTVTAENRDAVEAGCAEVEQAAARSHLDLRRLYGQQAEAFTWTLPLGLGPR